MSAIISTAKQSSNILDSMADDIDMADHLALVRKRIGEEGLSRLEMKLKFNQLHDEVNDEDSSDEVRALAQAEYQLVGELLAESAPPIPEPADVLEAMKLTNPEGAEQLQHTLAVQAALDKVNACRTAVEDAVAANFGDTYIKPLEAAYDSALTAHTELDAANPYFQREKDANAKLDESYQKHIAADAMGDSGDDGVQRAQAGLYQQADDLQGEAHELRNFTPTFGDAA